MSYLKDVGILKSQFKRVDIFQISRSNNNHADFLAILASSVVDPLPRIISIELLPFSSVIPSGKDLILSIQPSISWIDPIVAYLRNEIFLGDRKEVERIRHKSPQYWMFEEGKLYKRSYLGPYMLCMHSKAIEVFLEDLHEGICGIHTGGRLFAHRAFT